jgi:hypothetical protein
LTLCTERFNRSAECFWHVAVQKHHS